jgi:glycosyltransferase 2 family protein
VTGWPIHPAMNASDQDDHTAAPAAAPAGARQRLGRAIRYAFVAAALVAVVVLLWQQREEVSRALSAVSPWMVLVSLALATVGAWLPGVVWRDLLTSQGYPTAPVAGQRAFFLAQLGKYLPGGVWNLVAQVALARDLRIPGRQAATATFLTLALSVITSLLVAAATVPFAIPELLRHYWWVYLAVPVLVVMLHPRVVAWWSSRAFTLLRRPGRPVELAWPVLLRSTLLLVISWLAFGVHFGVLVQGLGHDRAGLWLLGIGVFALAWVAGFLVVIAPAGAGVREAVLTLGFAALLPAGAVLALAILSRVLLVVGDVLLALGFAVTARFPLARRRADASVPPA